MLLFKWLECLYVGVFPAQAGVNVKDAALAELERRIPRAGGGERLPLMTFPSQDSYSPRRRG